MNLRSQEYRLFENLGFPFTAANEKTSGPRANRHTRSRSSLVFSTRLKALSRPFPDWASRTASVKVARINAFAGKPQLQHFHVLRSIEHLPGEQSLRQDAHAAKRQAQRNRQSAKRQRAQKNIFHH